jgi:FlaG/FlaF family flagellin (archaellin)
MVYRTAIFVLMITFAAGSAAFAQERTRDFSATIPAAQLKTVVIEANVGNVRLTGGSGDSARIDLHLKATSNFSLWSGREWGDVYAVELHTEVRGDELRISLRGEHKNLSEDWTITVPARLAAQVNANVGEIDVKGLTGGCEAEVNVGHLRIDVPAGNIRATASVGDVRVTTGGRSFGEVDVETNVGDSRLTVEGLRVESNGRRYGPGERVRFSGRGRDRIDVKTNVGDAQVTIGY